MSGKRVVCKTCNGPAETIIGFYAECKRCDAPKEKATPTKEVAFVSPIGLGDANYMCGRCNTVATYPVDWVATGATCVAYFGSGRRCHGPLFIVPGTSKAPFP